MKIPRQFETERLVARPLEEADAALIFGAWGRDDEVLRYLTWPRHSEVAETVALVREQVRAWDEGQTFAYAVLLRPAVFVGYLRLTIEQPWRVSAGWIIAKEYWGRGIATELLRAVLDWVRGVPEIHRIWAMTHRDHAAAARVMEKAGMQREGVLRSWLVFPHLGPEPQDMVCYSMVRDGS